MTDAPRVRPCVRASVATIRDRAFWADSNDRELLWKLCDQMELRNQRTLRGCNVHPDVAAALQRVFKPNKPKPSTSNTPCPTNLT